MQLHTKASIVTVAILTAYLALFNSVSMHEVGIAFDPITGGTWLQQPGYYVTHPLVSVAVVDVRPHRVCVESASSRRATNCKLVHFDVRHYRDFVAVEGHRYYWLSNRLSFNSGYDTEYRGFVDVLRGYAYSSESYPFVVVR